MDVGVAGSLEYFTRHGGCCCSCEVLLNVAALASSVIEKLHSCIDGRITPGRYCKDHRPPSRRSPSSARAPQAMASLAGKCASGAWILPPLVCRFVTAAASTRRCSPGRGAPQLLACLRL
jgi:hypothetical protein